MEIKELKEILSTWKVKFDKKILKNYKPDDDVSILLKQLDAPMRVLIESIPLWNIPGLGPSKSAELWKRGVRPNTIKTIRDELPLITQLWLKYNPIQKFPREIIDPIIKRFIPQDETEYMVVGSYRRKRPTCNDIDIVYWGPSLEKFLKRLAERHGKSWIVFSKGPAKVSGLYLSSKGNVEIDIWIANQKNKAAMILYSTGSRLFNIKMRYFAKRAGYMLNQYGLFKNNKLIPLKTEEDIFKYIGLKYKEPEKRE
jgi:DNA polymerase/3'-5' exonuclease PolX